MMRLITVLFSAVVLFLAVQSADARVKVKGRGAAMNFDTANIPPQFQATFANMSKKCTKCHTMERTVIAVQTGRAPITGQPFNKQAVKAYGIKMLRKPNSGMNKQEIREFVVFLNYLLDENAR